jgi:Tfp pilus assembly protein PilZ
VKEVNDRKVTETYLKNISTTGFGIETSSLYSARGPLKISINLPNSEKEYILTGQVVWSRPVFQKPGRFMMGVRFHQPQWDIESLLRSLST